LRSGNVAFDDYREKELKRLEEERKRLDEELREFESYMSDLRRARDAEEFDRFMRDRANRLRNGGSVPESGGPADRTDL
jgi:Ser/Thr protein kinase RdoA (MazF antagonist)